MDRKYIDDHHIIARYLADRLSDDERDAFEAYYLEHPEIVQEMETTARFKAGLAQLQQSGELDALVERRPRGYNPRLVAAAAAVAAVALGIAFFTSRSPSVGPLLAATPAMLQPSGGVTLTIASTYQVLRTRSTTADAIVELPVTAHAIELEILPEAEAPSARYRVSFARLDGNAERQLAAVEHLSTNENGFVEVYLDSRGVQPGRYLVKLADESSPTARTSVFSLRIEAPAQ